MLLEVKAISAYYGRVAAIHDVSLDVKEGEIVCLVGPNGAGKSTTLMAICGVTPPATGEIRFDGRRIDGRPPHEIARLGIVQVPEGRRVFADLTIEENLEMGTYSGRTSRRDWPAERDRIYALFPRLAERRRQLGSTLSGGEQQMLAIGRALVARPRVLLLDEPSLGLAPMVVETIYRTIHEIRNLGMTILLVEQNVDIAWSFARRAYILESGTVAMAGATSELLGDARVRNTYLGTT